MKIQIRRSVFETNSSSVHSCAITTQDTFNDFKNDLLWYKANNDRYEWKSDNQGEYLQVDKAIEFNCNKLREMFTKYNLSKKQIDNVINEYQSCHNISEAFYNAELSDFYDDEIRYEIDYDEIYLSWDEFWEQNEYEDWEKSFVSPSGDKLVAWGYIGHD